MAGAVLGLCVRKKKYSLGDLLPRRGVLTKRPLYLKMKRLSKATCPSYRDRYFHPVTVETFRLPYYLLYLIKQIDC